jgi:integrase
LQIRAKLRSSYVRICPKSLRARAIVATERVGHTQAKWPNNGLRHSFASYRLAGIHDAPRVAVELGHTSPAMLYNTYREVALPEEAERYWRIEPTPNAANVVAFAG